MTGATGSSSSPDTPVLTVKLQGSEVQLDAKQVTIEDHDVLIDKAVIKMDDPNRLYTDFAREEQTLKIELGWGDESEEIFEGIVTRVEGTSQPTGQSESSGGHSVTLTAYDLSYRLRQSEDRQHERTGSLSSIIENVVSQHNITVGQIELDEDPVFTDTELLPLGQERRNDWFFIQALANRFGAIACVEYNEGESKFYFISQSKLLQGDSIGTLKLCPGLCQLIEFSYQKVANTSAAQRTTTTVNPLSGEVISSPEPEPVVPDEATEPDLVHQDNLARNGGDQNYQAAAELAASSESDPSVQIPQRITSGTPSDQNLTTQITHRNPTRLRGLYGEGKSIGTIELRAKSKIELLGISPWADGEWYVKKVVHKAIRDANTYESEFIVTR